MTDLALIFGNDLSVDATGDLAVSTGTEEGEERVLRRLLTNPNEYIWQAAYGAGLAVFLGQPNAAANIQAIIQSQLTQEAIVETDPPPVVTVTGQSNNSVFVTIQYVDANTGTLNVATFPVGGP